MPIAYPKKKMKKQVVLSLADSHHIGNKHNQKQRGSSNQKISLELQKTLRQKLLFQKTLQALELHLVSTGAFIEALGCQLPGNEDGDSSSAMTESQSLKRYLI